jgi:peptidoglycan hydrolase-like protein with peptidoglycan-binding domain
MAKIIHASVGEQCVNNSDDVRLIQRLLNDYNNFIGKQLRVDGDCGPKTFLAIREFQSRFLTTPTGRIENNSQSLIKLAELHLANAISGINTESIQQFVSGSLRPNDLTPSLFDNYWQLLRTS